MLKLSKKLKIAGSLLVAGILAAPALAQEAAPAAAPATTAVTAPAEASAATGGFSFGDEWGDSSSFFSEPSGSSAIDDLLAEPEWDGIRFGLGGYYRVGWNFLHEVDGNDTVEPTSFHYGQHRLRLKPAIGLNDKTFLYGDVIVGQSERGCTTSARTLIPNPCEGILGASGLTVLDTNLSDAFSNIRLVRFWGEVTTPVGVIRAGRQPSHWGLGLFSNDGDHGQEFGDVQFGDTYDRIAFATKPMGADSDFITALVYDLISEGNPISGVPGDPTLLDDGDDIHEGVLVLLYKTAPLDFGVYQVSRYQNRPRNYIWATDVYGRLDIGLIYAAFESVWLYGSSRAVPMLDQAALKVVEGGKLWVDGWGWASEVGLRFDWYDAKIKFGSAQGDQSSINDGKLSSLTFKPDYNVGLIMFDYAYANLIERQIASQFATLEALVRGGVLSPADVDKLSLVADLGRTRGAVTNAFYVNPIATFHPVKDLEAKLGVVWAETNDGVAIVGSGVNAEFAYSLGWEVDAGLEWTFRDRFSAGVEGGVFFPGEVFNRPETTVDPATGVSVQLAGPTEQAPTSFLTAVRLTYHLD